MNLISSLRDLRKVFLILVFLLVFFIMLSPPQDVDMWWHLSAGKAMVEQGQILTTDIFSYTRFSEPWTNAFWLSDIGLFLAYQAGGYIGITSLFALIAVFVMVLIYKQTVQFPFPLPPLVILLATFAIAPVWTPRPQIFSFLLLAVLDHGLNRQYGFVLKRPWILVPIFVLWANVHGGFIWGFLLLLAFIAGNGIDIFLKRENVMDGKRLGKMAFWTLVSAFAIALNPNGLSLWKLPFYTIGVSIRSITEWGSPDFHQIGLHPILWMVFLLIAGFASNRNRFSWVDILKMIGFSYMAFVSQRSIGPFVIIAAPIIINSLSPLWEEWTTTFEERFSRFYKSKPGKLVPASIAITLNLLILALFVSITILRVVSVSTPQDVHKGLPHNAVEWLRENQPEGRMFNAYNWGGYLQWELPEYPVFIDGRADLYGERLINDWWTVVNARDEALPILDEWQINFVLLEPGWPILEKLSENGWKTLYQDDAAVIMGRE